MWTCQIYLQGIAAKTTPITLIRMQFYFFFYHDYTTRPTETLKLQHIAKLSNSITKTIPQMSIGVFVLPILVLLDLSDMFSLDKPISFNTVKI